MSKKVSISVMAHPSRERYFSYLKEKLGNPPFSIDHTSEGIWPNCRRAWGMYDKNTQFHVVIQDDAIVCEDFQARADAVVSRALEVMNGKLFAISFYHGNKKEFSEDARRGLERGYTVRERPGWGVAICLPTAVIPDMLKTCDTFKEWQDDERITKFLLARGMQTYFPLPSLIDHRTSGETPSLVGDMGEGRHAFAFIDTPHQDETTTE